MASKLRVHEVELYAQPDSHLRIYEVEASSAAPLTHLRVYEIALASSAVPTKLRIYELEIFAAPPVVANQTVESLSTVTIPAGLTQTAGPPVTLAGSGGTRTFIAPATVDGATIVFTGGGTDTTIAVRAHQWWVLRGTAWRPGVLSMLP